MLVYDPIPIDDFENVRTSIAPVAAAASIGSGGSIVGVVDVDEGFGGGGSIGVAVRGLYASVVAGGAVAFRDIGDGLWVVVAIGGGSDVVEFSDGCVSVDRDEGCIPYGGVGTG